MEEFFSSTKEVFSMFPFINSVGAALCGHPFKEPTEGLPYIT
jgi:hypothetical protein